MKNLAVKNRTVIGKKVKNLRTAKTIPAVVYGPNMASVNLELDYKEFAKMFADVGFSKLLDIEVNAKHQKVLVKEVQIHPVLRSYRHVSFYAVDMDQPITANVPLEIEGIAPAVKNNLGFLEVPTNTVVIKCLPANLPSVLKIDISKLENIGDGVSIADLNLSEDVEVMGMDKQHRLVFIAAPQKEIVEEEPVIAAVEGEEGAEGAEGTEGAEGEAGKEGKEGSGSTEKKEEKK